MLYFTNISNGNRILFTCMLHLVYPRIIVIKLNERYEDQKSQVNNKKAKDIKQTGENIHIEMFGEL